MHLHYFAIVGLVVRCKLKLSCINGDQLLTQGYVLVLVEFCYIFHLVNKIDRHVSFHVNLAFISNC